MKLLLAPSIGVIVAAAASVDSAAVAAPGPGPACYWQGAKSGTYLECLPDYYIRGACESGSCDDCQVDSSGIIGSDASFGIRCCPSESWPGGLDFHEQRDCEWLGGDSGVNVPCKQNRAAFGRCSTSQRSNGGGDCNNMSHQVKCCTAKSEINEETCGWIYGRYGTKQNCPDPKVVTGFCGVNNKSDCANNKYMGIRCCRP